MAFSNNNSGALFKSERKSENSPDLSGPLNVDGKEYRVFARLKEGAKGKFYSLKLVPANGAARPETTSTPDPDDEIPF